MRLLLGIVALCVAAGLSSGGSSTLTIQVQPEAYVNPASIDLTFNVIHPGEMIDNTSLQVYGWVRALPGQSIRLTASAALLDPSGAPVDPRWLHWAGALTRATGGAATSSCTNGSFSFSGPQDLVAGWKESGIAMCAITFSLATGSDWRDGSYHARVALAVRAQ